MKYRVHNQQNWSKRMGMYFNTYFRTKKEAMEYAQQLGNGAVVERKVVETWVVCGGV